MSAFYLPSILKSLWVKNPVIIQLSKVFFVCLTKCNNSISGIYYGCWNDLVLLLWFIACFNHCVLLLLIVIMLIISNIFKAYITCKILLYVTLLYARIVLRTLYKLIYFILTTILRVGPSLSCHTNLKYRAIQ